MPRTCLFALALGIASPVIAQGQPNCQALADQLLKEKVPANTVEFEQREQPLCRIDQGCLEVDWSVATKQQLTQTLAQFRFTEKTPLKVHTTNLNFLQYNVKWSQTVERQDKAFESVSTLFEKVFPVLSLFGLDRSAEPLLDPLKAMTRWVILLERASLCLSDTVVDYTTVVVDKAGTSKRRRLYEVHGLLARGMPKLTELRLLSLDEAARAMGPASGFGDATYMDLYWKVSQRQSDLEHRVTEFLPLAEATYNGQILTVGSVKRNSYVDATGQAFRRSSAEPVGEALSARYFVAWSRPLLYHVGYGYGRLRDIEFKQVRSASGHDVFSATRPDGEAVAGSESDDKPGPESVAFMTLELLTSGPNARYALGLTFGTGLNAPGESLYAGGTFRIFSRVMLSGGVVVARATRGDTPLIDDIASGGPRVVYATLTEDAAVKPFLSISFKVY